MIEVVSGTAIPSDYRGESGTERVVISHPMSTASGADAPFVSVNCGAFTDTLESDCSLYEGILLRAQSPIERPARSCGQRHHFSR